MNVPGSGEYQKESVAISLEESSEIGSPPYTTSRLLCPSNLGALLESTTATLVSGGWKDPGVGVSRNSDEDTSQPLRNEELYERQFSTEQQSAGSRFGSEVHEIVLPVDFEPEIDHLPSACDDHTLPGNGDHTLPVLVSPIPLQNSSSLPATPSPQPSHHSSPLISAHAPTPPSTHISAPPSTHAIPLLLQAGPCTVGETSCYSSDLDLRRQHQLCIPIDEGSAVVYTPSSYINHGGGSQRSSVCSAALNEGESVGVVKQEVKTHSRNVSETPSLPPFYSSSTSSAYHSRNSSLGSQMSSCFETDSMLNQLTDIDSCLAVQTGSNTDLRHLKLIQESRFSHRGDSSPSSCSSDLNLHHHMTKPLESMETIVNISPLNLEETLRNLSLDKLEDYKKKLSMKSSEWIKKELDSHRDSLVVVKVSSKSKHVVHFNVKAGDIIIWEFATKKKDIAFGVTFEATEVATEQSPLPDSHESLDRKMCAILPIFRVTTQAHPTIGTHTASLDGIYEITFDNSYSRFFAKELYYRITTQPSQPNAHYLEQ